jgi:hypothetical protein
MLLIAAGRILAHSIETANRPILQMGQQLIKLLGGRTTGTAATPGNLTAGLEALLCLSHTLVSDGTWWQEAKIKHPLHLIDALYMISTVSMCAAVIWPCDAICACMLHGQ